MTIKEVNNIVEEFENLLQECDELEEPQERFKEIKEKAHALYYEEMEGRFSGDYRHLAHFALRTLIKNCAYAENMNGSGTKYQYRIQEHFALEKM